MKFVRVCLFSVAVLSSARSAQSDLIQVSGDIVGQASQQNVGSKNMSCNVPSCADSQIDFRRDSHLVLALDGSAAAGDSIATFHAVANATIGKIGVGILGAAVASQGGSADAGTHGVSASWTDNFEATSLSQPLGSTLILHCVLFLDGDLSGTATGKGTAGAFFKIFDLSTFPGLPPGPYGNNDWGDRLVAPSSTPPFDISQEVPGAIRVTQTTHIGERNSIGYRLVLSGGATSDQTRTDSAGGGAVSADVSNSLRWGGIESVTDEFGNPIDDWTVTSESGFDFSKPFGVPEPSSLVLVAIALCSGWPSRRRRFRSH
jgi:hypothetical protein